MKTILQKSLILVTLALFAFQVQGQACPEVWTENGTYKIGVCTSSTGDQSSELYMTINGSTGALEWAALLPNDDPTQVWTITDHRTPSGNGFVEIWATIPGAGDYTMAVDQSTYTGAGDKNLALTVVPGQPIADNTDANYGYDQFQRRRTSGFGGPGNDALFAKPPGEGGSRYGVVPSAAGDQVLFDGGGIDGIRFVFVSTLSNEDFDTSSVFITNPVNNELNIQGLTADVQQVSVYSLLGKEILSIDVNTQSTLSLDVSDLATGMYLVKFQGDRSFFTKKFIKQ